MCKEELLGAREGSNPQIFINEKAWVKTVSELNGTDLFCRENDHHGQIWGCFKIWSKVPVRLYFTGLGKVTGTVGPEGSV